MKAHVGMRLRVWPGRAFEALAEIVHVTEKYAYGRCIERISSSPTNDCVMIYDHADLPAEVLAQIPAFWFQHPHLNLFDNPSVFQVLPPTNLPTTEFGDDT